MTSKERVTAAIEFKYPDRIPLQREGVDWRNEREYPESLFPNDIISAGAGGYDMGTLPGRNMDNWGCEWLNLKPPALGQVVNHPLNDITALDCYKPPNPEDLDLFCAKVQSEKRGDKYLVLGYVMLFERLINLRGFENLLMDIAEPDEYFFRMRDMVLTYNLAHIDRLLALKPDAVYLADDWGSQISLMISPASWRALFLPAYRLMFDKVKAVGAHVFFHSDGHIKDILPDLIEAGANVFWVEFGVNPLDSLAGAARGKAAFLSLYDTQYIEFAAAEDCDAHVRECIEKLGGRDGGFIGRYYPDATPRGLRLLKLYQEADYNGRF